MLGLATGGRPAYDRYEDRHPNWQFDLPPLTMVSAREAILNMYFTTMNGNGKDITDRNRKAPLIDRSFVLTFTSCDQSQSGT
jgi:hypothetical protein